MLVIIFRASNGVRKCLNGNPAYKNVSRCLHQTLWTQPFNPLFYEFITVAPVLLHVSNILLQF